jgi:HD-GYP domain-containing protein (c-di-GMP phosphodiesterase class II)
MAETGTATTATARARYFAADLATLRADRLLSFDLYVCVEGQMILYRERSLAFSDDVRRRLLDNRVRQVYIHASQRPQFLGYMEHELPELLRDDHIAPSAKANIVYDTSKVIVENIFENPTFGDNIRRSENLVEETVRFLTHDADSFRNLVKLSDTDYMLYSHCVNVCTFSLGLGQQAGVNDPAELAALGIGAMLHDVGKTRIDPRIMKKRTQLTHAEFELMKRHVEYGVDILNQISGIPRAAYIPVMQHGEREDGSGYPRGLPSDQIHLFGKITAIADVFDAITTNRVYRRALTAYDAFKEMLGMPLDQKLLHLFIQLLGPEHEPGS